MSEPVYLNIEDKVATLMLNRPDHGNAIDLQTAKQLFEKTLKVHQDKRVKVVVLKAEGKNFSFGGDLRSFQEHGDHVGAHLRELTSYLHQAIILLAKMDKPIVGKINGVAAGAGLSLICLCDVVIAGESAKFTPSYTKVGLSPDGSCTYILPRLVGLRKAQDFLLLNPIWDAEKALNEGLITRKVSNASLDDEVETIVTSFLTGSKSANAKTKKLLQMSFLRELEEHLTLESDMISEQSGLRDGKEGVASFVEKRPPVFD
ncbi:enoyl-CoA hydratase/isomerase family protein [Virgibacillus byunsanensis]|uniref:Enoyl-CoA hydratase/isomerase family protein n=1 Tax=Virgibacillus byunsanensis TaxID=570945 RepID=A0ABW3LJ79_9BACI